MLSLIKNIWFFYILNVFAIFFSLVAIHYQLDNSILVSSLWKNPITFWEFYIPRILFSVALSNLIFYVKNKFWSMIPILVVTIFYFISRSLNLLWLDLIVIILPIILFLVVKNTRNDICSNLNNLNLFEYIFNIIFILVLFIQCIIFHYISFDDYSIFLRTIHLKLSIVFIFSSISFLIKNKKWLLFIDIIFISWMMSELMYYRANGIYIDSYTITMIGNMNGFWNSLKTLYMSKDFLLFIPTLALIVPFFILYPKKISFNGFNICLSLGIILNILACLEFQSDKIINKISNKETTNIKRVELNPFSEFAMGQLVSVSMVDYIKNLSVLHAIIYNINDYIRNSISSSQITYKKEEIQVLEKIINKNNNNKISNNIQIQNQKLIIILLESFESWSINKIYTPNIFNFINKEKNILYVKNISSQIRGGTSSDGQFIINTGLLPIQKGAICFRYPYNKYPSLSSLYKNSAGVFPHGLDVWNQQQMSTCYEIDKNYTTVGSDKVVINKIIEISPLHDFILAITCQTHTPFEAVCDSSNIEISLSYPEHLRNYIKSINYLDKQLGALFNSIQSDSIFKECNIVITSDHKIFSKDIRSYYKKSINKFEFDENIENEACPLIVYSPNISNSICDTTSVYYQMDVYPTILALVEANYYWKGFGVNILEEKKNHKRYMSEDDYFILSDKLIRSNYFENNQ